jgi:magnesium chelatase family protein
MFSKIYSCAAFGLNASLVECELDMRNGEPRIFLVGLADAAIKEAIQRFISAIKNSGFEYPYGKRLTINLAPAHLPKEGTHYDLAMAVGILFNAFAMPFESKNKMFIGELSLDGKVKRINGLIPMLMFAKENGFTEVFVPAGNLSEATLVSGLKIYPVKDLRQTIEHLLGEVLIEPCDGQLDFSKYKQEMNLGDYDFKYVCGQREARRALEIAAAGGHNLRLIGSPGSGKTFMSRALLGILPDLDESEIMELTKIYSVAGLLNEDNPVVTQRPFRAPHHSVSGVALIGGGRVPKPGEITLAHRGVLFLDEFAEFPRPVLEALRQPLEDGIVSIGRARGHLTFPARFSLVAAQNPCPCGYHGDPHQKCTCTANHLTTYQKKVSGPLLDRIDLHLHVLPVSNNDLTKNSEKRNLQSAAEDSQEIRKRVVAARAIQRERLEKYNILTNAEMGSRLVREFCRLELPAEEYLHKMMDSLHLSARAYYRVLKVSRSIADLAGDLIIKKTHVMESLQYRLADGGENLL